MKKIDATLQASPAIITVLGLFLALAVATASARPQSADKKAGGAKAAQPGNLQPGQPVADRAKDESRKIVREGIAVEFTIERRADAADKAGAADKSDALKSEEDAIVRFKVSDKETGTAITGLRPASWIDLQADGKASDDKACKQKIQSFLQGSLKTRPDLDLNSYYILALNRDPTVSVIDPLLGYGGSKLLTLVLLKSPGEDWVLSQDGKRLFVTLPLINQVAVIDTATWKVTENIDVGMKPTRVALQGDGRYLWVGSNALDAAGSGVTVIDTASLKVAARIRTGAGHHELAFAPDDRVAFVTNRQDGTVSVIDVQKLVKIMDIKTGDSPSSIAVSKLSKAVYVANEGDGAIFILDGDSHAQIARIDAGRGVRVIRFSPDGRWGFAANAKENLVHIIDSSTNRIVETVPVGQSPDQISFTAGYAYVRSIGTEIVHSIALASLGKGASASIAKFPGGQIPPMNATGLNISDTIVAAPDGASVLIANPADKIIYYYMEGMAAPMGNFQNYKREPRGVMVVDRSLRETSPGVYSTSIKFARGGNYDVAFLLGAPRIAHCFDLAVKSNPASEKWSRQTALHVEPLYKDKLIRVGEATKLRFKLTDPATNLPKVGLKDVGVLTFLAPGLWNKRHTAQSNGEGIYEIEFVPPEAGPYYVFIESPSLKVKYRHLPYMILEATAGRTR